MVAIVIEVSQLKPVITYTANANIKLIQQEQQYILVK